MQAEQGWKDSLSKEHEVSSTNVVRIEHQTVPIVTFPVFTDPDGGIHGL